MYDGGMVPSSQVASDGLERSGRHIPAQVHDDLSWVYDFLITFLGWNIQGGKAEMIGNHLDNQVRGHFPLGIGGNDVL